MAIFTYLSEDKETRRSILSAKEEVLRMQAAEQKRRMVVGDIHGELEGFIEIIKNAGLIDDECNWIGGSDILIQTGDVIDRGPYSLEAVDLLKELQIKAADAKGKVIRLCGNHELMILQKDFRYANFKNRESFAAELKRDILQGNVLASYTDGERLYTHAGLRSIIKDAIEDRGKANKHELKSSKINLFGLSENINKIFRDCVENDSLAKHPIFHVGRDRGGSDPVGGIFWCDFSSVSNSEEAWLIPQVFGHTLTKKNEVKTAQGLSLIDVDAGMCRVYGGERVYLEITSDGDLLQHSKVLLKWKTKLLGKMCCASSNADPH